MLSVVGTSVTLIGSGFTLLQPILVSELIVGMSTAQIWWDLKYASESIAYTRTRTLALWSNEYGRIYL